MFLIWCFHVVQSSCGTHMGLVPESPPLHGDQTPWRPNSLETKLCGCSIPYRKWHHCAYNLYKASCTLKIISGLLILSKTMQMLWKELKIQCKCYINCCCCIRIQVLLFWSLWIFKKKYFQSMVGWNHGYRIHRYGGPTVFCVSHFCSIILKFTSCF